jgi:hypothetical protein
MKQSKRFVELDDVDMDEATQMEDLFYPKSVTVKELE